MSQQPTRASRPWHMLFLPVLPIVTLLANHLELLTLQAAVPSLAAALAANCVLALMLTLLVGSFPKAAFAASTLTYLFMSQAEMTWLADTTRIPRVFIVGPLPAVLAAGLITQMRSVAGWTTFANAFGLIGVCFAAWQIVPVVAGGWSREPSATPVAVAERPQKYPDVYVVILDGYGREDVLRQLHGFDNPLPGELRRLGFEVADAAISNYGQTAQSIASSLNLDYLPSLLSGRSAGRPARHRLGDLISDNRTFRTLADAGYRIRVLESEYGLVQPAPAHETRGPWLSINDFEFGLYAKGMGPLLCLLGGIPQGAPVAALHRRQIRWTLEQLASDLPSAADPPTLVFAHISLPHPPFVFEADGRPFASQLPATLADGTEWTAAALAASSRETYRDGYVKAMQYLNLKLLNALEQIIGRSDREVVAYVQADHGSGSHLDWDDVKATNLTERFSILLAAHFPRKETTLYPTISPVNAMRLTLNRVVNAKLETIDDRSYFSSWDEPLSFTDVTDAVRAGAIRSTASQ